MRIIKLFRHMAASINKAYLQVVGCETIDTTASFLLFTDSKRYLFNCGEGTQRLFNENKIRFHKLSNIFFTKLSWDTLGGLPGMAMTLRDSGKENLGLFGPKYFQNFIHATRHFMFQEKLQLNCTEFVTCEDKFEDENLTVQPVILSGNILESNLPKERNKAENPNKRRRITPANYIVSYICSLPLLPGKFLVDKAKALGVPKGPLFGKLKCGEDVILKNGQKVLAKDVTEPSQPGPVFFIIDCPSTDYIPSLVQSEQFSVHKQPPLQPCLVIHLVPKTVFENNMYKQWRMSFGDSTHHLIVNKDVCDRSTMFQSQARIQIKLHTIDEELFPLLYSSKKTLQDSEVLPTNTIPAKSLLKFHIRPQKLQGFDTADITADLDIDAIMNDTINVIKQTGNNQHIALINSNPRVQKLQRTSQGNTMSTQQENITSVGNSSVEKAEESDLTNLLHCDGELSCKYDKRNEDFQVVFIGTGASLPSKYRNVSSTLIHTSNSSAILLDCGEGTLGQLYRHYGDNFDSIINKINCIFISHIHADHHLGLIRILLHKKKLKDEASDATSDEMHVIGPAKINLWLQEYSYCFEHLDYRFVNCKDIVNPTVQGDLTQMCKQTHGLELTAVPVVHCADAYGLVFKHINGWKIVYSGDTRPCSSLVNAGRDATLLIHEATLDDELYEEALDKRHCTTTEAVNTGKDMNAGFIMLNHFSQRYPKIPVISEQFTKNTGIAFDHMRVSPNDFSRIPSLFPLLNVIFADEVEEMNKKTKLSSVGSEVASNSSNKT